MDYSVFDEFGTKIGEIREDVSGCGSGCLTSAIFVGIGLCVCAFPFVQWYIILGEIVKGEIAAMLIVVSIFFTVTLHARSIIKKGMTSFAGSWVALTISSGVTSGIVALSAELFAGELMDSDVLVFLGTISLAVIPALIGTIVISIKER